MQQQSAEAQHQKVQKAGPELQRFECACCGEENSNPETCILNVYWKLRVYFSCSVMISQWP